MGTFQEINKNSKTVVENSKSYVKTTQKYIELKTFQQISLVFTLLFKSFVLGSLLLIGFTILVIEGVLLLADYLENYHIALLVSSGVLLLLTVVVYFFRKMLIESPVIKMVQKTFFEN